MTRQYKFELQSSHFRKKQFSLHCTVKHLPDLVDAMSSFGVKAPIHKAVLTEDFRYQNDTKKHYLIEKNETEKNEIEVVVTYLYLHRLINSSIILI